MAKEVVPFMIGRLNEQVERNGGYLASTNITWADIVFVAVLEYLNDLMGYDIIEKAAFLKILRTKILELPKIKEWIAKRPSDG